MRILIPGRRENRSERRDRRKLVPSRGRMPTGPLNSQPLERPLDPPGTSAYPRHSRRLERSVRAAGSLPAPLVVRGHFEAVRSRRDRGTDRRFSGHDRLPPGAGARPEIAKPARQQ